MLNSILRLIPTGPTLLLPLLTEHFPHKTETLQAHQYYITNLIQMKQYIPELSFQIWYLMIERTIQIDASFLFYFYFILLFTIKKIKLFG
jgi:RNA polymerase I-specific transcription initiation factor RRN3